MKKAVLGLSLSVLLGSATAVGINFATGNQDVVNASSEVSLASVTTEHVDETLAQVSFKMKKPKKLPFQETETLSSQKNLGNGKLVQLNYRDKNSKGFVVLDATDMQRNLASEKYPITTVVLANGTTASFTDNGVVQVLFWAQDGVSYSIKATRGEGKKAFNAAELADIANSVE
ncbi:MAG: hypothetical protein WCC10_08430 [Tumebacillaceae bacterium]